MLTFIEETLQTLKNQHDDLSEFIFILPSKRAGSFLRNQIKAEATITQFAPQIWSAEEFVEHISQLSIIDNTELLFKSYQIYLNTSAVEIKESFESYSPWAITLLNDFNEIDRYMVPVDEFFDYLMNIKTLERWGVEKETSTIISNYLKFWESLPEFHANLKSLLEQEHTGFQGMVYRKAAVNIHQYIENNPSKKHIFIGFNALNTAEQKIIQSLLAAGESEIYWDTDKSFMDNRRHSTSHFIRKYLEDWDYYSDKEKPIFPSNFNSEKKFKIIEVQKNVGQAKYVGELLASLSEETMQKTAVVLGDETLLTPLLRSLPNNVSQVNVTMGMPLKNFPGATFFELLLNLHLHPGENLYYKDVMSILNHPFGQDLVSDASQITKRFHTENITHISPAVLYNPSNAKDREVLKLLFDSWDDNGPKAVETSLKLLRLLSGTVRRRSIESLTVQKLIELFQNIKGLSEKYPYLNSIKTVFTLFTELLQTSSFDFEGDAFEGLQIMGVLETRVLDFENIIITSVNEGIFPSGKSNSSFITYDLKQEFQLPLYMEKDAIYTYHFYRLIQRAKNITLLYSGHSEGMNTGEKSRFLSQLEVDQLKNHEYEKQVITSHINIAPTTLKEIHKTEEVLERIKRLAEKGFSPSALTSYIRNPIDFYFQKILMLQEAEEVEENVAANTLGTIVHDTLEAFYKPLEGSILNISVLEAMKSRIHGEVTKQFQKTFKGGTFSKGKNLIVFEVAKRYIQNFINLEMEDVNAGNEIEIVQIETKLTMNVPMDEIPFPVNLRGIVDRVDRYNGKLRIIDYKTGKVDKADVEITDWETITEDYKHSKAFQILAYVAMISQEVDFHNAEAGIISFKNLTSGFLPFGTKTAPRSPRNNEITEDVLSAFNVELTKLIMEICNPDIPFIEKEI